MVGFWPSFSDAECAEMMHRLDAPEALMLGLHNRAVAGLPGDLRDRIFAELETRGICDRPRAEAVLSRTAALSG